MIKKIKEKQDLNKNLIEDMENKNQEKGEMKKEDEKEKKKKKKIKKEDKYPEKEQKFLSKKTNRDKTQPKKNENKTEKINPEDFIIKRIRKKIIKIKIIKKRKKVSKKINGKKFYEILLDDSVDNETKTKYLNAYLGNLSRV